MREIAVDMDGVMADFVGYCIERYGHGPATLNSKEWDDFWNVAVPNDEAFYKMGYEHEALVLWNFVRSLTNVRVVILTAANTSKNNLSVDQKMRWCLERLPSFTPDMFNHVDSSESKVDYLKSHPETILIDDMLSNIKSWFNAGGTCIHHIHTTNTIKELKNMGFN